METRLSSTHGSGRLLLASVVALALVMTLGTTSVLAASPSVCRVQNTDTGKTYTALQAAVDAASKGDRLTVRGTCIGKTVIDTKLVIEGIRTAISGKPTLSGGGKSRVVTITKGVRVRMRSLEIVRGSSSKGSGGGGILNKGTVTLIDIVVRGNRAHEPGGGGIYNAGTLTLTGSSRVTSNTAGSGGGISNAGTLTLNDSSTISGNTARRGSGGGVASFSAVVLNGDSSISHNTADVGGGVDVHPTVGLYESTLTLNGDSRISGNIARRWGGGILISLEGWCCGSVAGSVTLNDDSRISGNRAHIWGGGVRNLGSLTLRGNSSISGNTVLRDDGEYGGGFGGGVHNHAAHRAMARTCMATLPTTASRPHRPQEAGRGPAWTGADRVLRSS